MQLEVSSWQNKVSAVGSGERHPLSTVITGRREAAGPESRAENSDRAALDSGFALARAPDRPLLDLLDDIDRPPQ
jgi:hypothetical protein